MYFMDFLFEIILKHRTYFLHLKSRSCKNTNNNIEITKHSSNRALLNNKTSIEVIGQGGQISALIAPDWHQIG